MRCSCNAGNRTRYITHTLMGVDHDDMYPLQPDPIKLCMFYHSIVKPADWLWGMERYMAEQGYIVARSYTAEWDKKFAHPTQAWTLERCETDEFDNEQLESNCVLQVIIREVFFETNRTIRLSYLTDVLTGLSWEYCVRAAGRTIQQYFKKEQVTGEREQEEWLTRLEDRGMDREVREWLATSRQHEREYRAWANSRV